MPGATRVFAIDVPGGGRLVLATASANSFQSGIASRRSGVPTTDADEVAAAAGVPPGHDMERRRPGQPWIARPTRRSPVISTWRNSRIEPARAVVRPGDTPVVLHPPPLTTWVTPSMGTVRS